MQKRVAPLALAACARFTTSHDLHQLLALEARVVAHALRAVRAVLRAGAGLDRQQGAHLHLVRLEVSRCTRCAWNSRSLNGAVKIARASSSVQSVRTEPRQAQIGGGHGVNLVEVGEEPGGAQHPAQAVGAASRQYSDPSGRCQPMRRNQVYMMSTAGPGGCCHPVASCAVARGNPPRSICVPCEAEMPACPGRATAAARPDVARGWARQLRAVPVPRVALPAMRRALVLRIPGDHLVQALKYEGALANARVFGMRLGCRWGARNPGSDGTARPDAAAPGPSRRTRLQPVAGDRSRRVAPLDLELAGHALHRIRATAPQVGLARNEPAT